MEMATLMPRLETLLTECDKPPGQHELVLNAGPDGFYRRGWWMCRRCGLNGPSMIVRHLVEPRSAALLYQSLYEIKPDEIAPIQNSNRATIGESFANQVKRILGL